MLDTWEPKGRLRRRKGAWAAAWKVTHIVYVRQGTRLIANVIVDIWVCRGVPQRLALSAGGVERERCRGARGGAIGDGRAEKAPQRP
jgi:hypothetical protein